MENHDPFDEIVSDFALDPVELPTDVEPPSMAAEMMLEPMQAVQLGAAAVMAEMIEASEGDCSYQRLEGLRDGLLAICSLGLQLAVSLAADLDELAGREKPALMLDEKVIKSMTKAQSPEVFYASIPKDALIAGIGFDPFPKF